MQKTLRIVAKDIAHLKWEILLSLAFTAGFAATEHFNWPIVNNHFTNEAENLGVWMAVLMPIGWWLILTRDVQDESLVGDRQFWITRPYTWPRILIAKLIFIAIFICLPFLLAQCFLLHQAGFVPFIAMHRLFDTQWMLLCFFLLPLLALACVTANLTRTFLFLLAFVVYVALLMYGKATFMNDATWVPGDSVAEMARVKLFCLFIPPITAIVVFLQYARRRTKISLGLLVGLILFVTAGLMWRHSHVIDPAYFPKLAANETSPLTVTLDQDPVLQAQVPDSGSGNHLMRILSLPVVLSGMAPGHAIQVAGKKVLLEVDGVPVENTRELPIADDPSGNEWRSGYGRYLSAATPENLQLMLPLDAYNRAMAKTLTVHLVYAVDDFEALTPVTVSAKTSPFKVPGDGLCTIKSRNAVSTGDSMICSYPHTPPEPTRITWTLQQTCGVSAPSDIVEEHWAGEMGNYGSIGLSPIEFRFTGFPTTYERSSAPVVSWCPTSPITFTSYRLVRHRLVEFTLPPVDPSKYLRPSPPSTRAY